MAKIPAYVGYLRYISLFAFFVFAILYKDVFCIFAAPIVSYKPWLAPGNKVPYVKAYVRILLPKFVRVAIIPDLTLCFNGALNVLTELTELLTTTFVSVVLLSPSIILGLFLVCFNGALNI